MIIPCPSNKTAIIFFNSIRNPLDHGFFYKPCHRLYKTVPQNFVQSECWILALRVQVSQRNWELLIFCQIIDLFNESRSLCTSAFSFERLKVKISAPRKLASIQGKVWFTLFSVTMVKFSFNFSPPAIFKSWHWLRDEFKVTFQNSPLIIALI